MKEAVIPMGLLFELPREEQRGGKEKAKIEAATKLRAKAINEGSPSIMSSIKLFRA
jgi:hypothetical protein